MNPYAIRFKTGAPVLELGGGSNPLRDQNNNRLTFNVDMLPGPNVEKVTDFNEPLPFPDNSWDGVFSKYAIEHISWHNVEKFIKEIYRVLKPGGKVIIFTSNTLEQCKKVVEEGINKGTVELLFGSQEFPAHGGVHKTGFSPEYAIMLFKKTGFGFVKTFPHPVSNTDLILEAYKINENEVFERQYFDDGTIGYKGYRDFATHFSTTRIIMENNPSSVLDIGGGRGYIVKRLENEGVKAVCMDISRHCQMTRATKNFVLHDVRNIPWPFKDKEFDIVFSINLLEHISEEHIDTVIKESIRVSNRGIHGIHFPESPFEERDPDIDITHQLVKSETWWNNKFKSLNPDYPVKLGHPRILEFEKPEQQPPVSIAPASPDNLIKLNIGSFQDMFYYGWMNIDILDLSHFAKTQAYDFKQHDIRKGIPYDNNSVDIVFSSHLIEHLNRWDGQKFLKECLRVLKPGGILRISTPDALQLTNEYINGDIMKYRFINVGVEQAHDDAEAFHELLMSGHQTIYDKNGLTKTLMSTGFKKIEPVNPFQSRSDIIKKQTLTTHPDISLILEATR